MKRTNTSGKSNAGRSAKPDNSGRAVLVIGLILLLLLAVGGWLWFSGSSTQTAAQPNQPSPTWPTETLVDRYADRHALVVFVKPNDPASLEHLETLHQVARQRRVYSTVVFSKTGERELDDQSRRVLQRAQEIPNTNVIFDDRGSESQRFGLFQCPGFSVYDPAGELVTSGNHLPSQSPAVMNVLPGQPAAPTYSGVAHANRWSTQNHAID